MPQKTDAREYRNMLIIEIEKRDGEGQEENNSKVVTGYATVFNTRYPLFRGENFEVWEQVDPHAFDNADMTDVIMQYNHEGRVMARTRNNTLTVEPDIKGLAVRADLSGTDLGRELYEEIAGGYTDRMSFGFTVSEEIWEIEEDHETGREIDIRTITGIKKLYDVSAVSMPANDATDISARNLADGVIDRRTAERLEERRKEELKKKLQLRLRMED